LTDLTTGEHNGAITPGEMTQLVGRRLKFDPTDSQQGLFFIAADGPETRVDKVGRNKPAELIFGIPASLTAGSYKLEVRSTLTGGALRVGALDDLLIVTCGILDIGYCT
jgi:hypothetical protein